VANSLSTGTGLKMGTAVGSRPIVTEQEMLVSNEDGELSSKIDILITTPGRLVDHIRSTPGFSLKWVCWLVIDEADRLLAQSFQEWVDVVIGGLERAAIDKPREIGGVDLGDFGIRKRRENKALRKVVLSATMTRDIGKLSGLKLKQPKLVVVEDTVHTKKARTEAEVETARNGEQFSVPIGLREHAVPVGNLELKPLCLLYLLRMKNIKTGALVFVKSNEAAARLAKLIGAVASDSWRVELVSGEMEKKRREKVLRRFRKGDIDL
jgi:ATP-dependent RNA helicase DDX51/DBP6